MLNGRSSYEKPAVSLLLTVRTIECTYGSNKDLVSLDFLEAGQSRSGAASASDVKGRSCFIGSSVENILFGIWPTFKYGSKVLSYPRSSSRCVKCGVFHTQGLGAGEAAFFCLQCSCSFSVAMELTSGPFM